MWQTIVLAVLSIGFACGLSLFVAESCNNVRDKHGVLNPPWEEPNSWSSDWLSEE